MRALQIRIRGLECCAVWVYVCMEAAATACFLPLQLPALQVDGDVMMSSYVRSDSSPSVSWKVGSFQAFVEAKVRRS